MILAAMLVLTQPPPPIVAPHFVICGSAKRINCVVDGDTFWMNRVKIRIADIDAPEISQPLCRSEKALGESAKWRLVHWLNAGHFVLMSSGRDQDRNGRKLRVPMRGRERVSDVLIREGLARRWDGRRRSWCVNIAQESRRARSHDR